MRSVSATLYKYITVNSAGLLLCLVGGVNCAVICTIRICNVVFVECRRFCRVWIPRHDGSAAMAS